VIAGLTQRVRAALVAGGVGAGDRLVVGCSHGPDSLALADFVLGLRRPLALAAVTLVYVDHGLRPEASAEAARVEAFARAAGADAEVVRVTVARRGRGLEDAARRARRTALAAVAKRLGARFVLLGHTADDQAETVLLRLLRGTGPRGLAAMAPRAGRFVRPLLGTTRAEIENYLAARGLEPSLDPSNQSQGFTRNRVRHELLPLLRRENPAIAAALCRLAAGQRELVVALDQWVRRARRQVLAPSAARRDLDRRLLRRFPDAIAKRLLLDLGAELGQALEARHLQALLDFARAGSDDGSLSLPGLSVARRGPALTFERRDTPVVPTGIRVIVTVAAPRSSHRVRLAAPGDRMRPALPGSRTRPLSELLREAQVPAAARAAAVVVEDAAGRVVWAEHLGSAHGAAIGVSLTHLDPRVTPSRRAADT
jgi:tRNA(Ile)-lysidine synthase